MTGMISKPSGAIAQTPMPDHAILTTGIHGAGTSTIAKITDTFDKNDGYEYFTLGKNKLGRAMLHPGRKAVLGYDKLGYSTLW
ncbi:MAG: hypothetical protein Q8L68_06415 [Methylococcales bacterium]|nr:hypothetical protein [Methylococcales bacterium]